MVTVALVAMFGIVGLAVDLGWAYFIKKSAQNAADAAALAAVSAALAGGPIASMTCGGGTVTCAPTPIPCPATGNLQNACLYAAQNGFSPATARQNVTVQASDAATAPTVTGCTPTVQHPPTAPCVDTPYWVTVRVSEQIPQLFSAVLGNATATVTARATAAVAKVESIGSLILLNREGEAWIEDAGTNLYVGGTPQVNVPGGILLSSADPVDAGKISGGGTVISPFTYIRTGGDIDARVGSWVAEPTNRPDGGMFYDPFRDRPQPPIAPSTTNIPVPVTNQGALISASNVTACSSGVCPPGNYYAINPNTGQATGEKLEIADDVTFGGSGFGDYVFFGGMEVGQADVTFGPGRYVFAGVANSSTPVFDMDNKAFLRGGTSQGSDAGRMFILTDSSYEGRLDTTVANIPNKTWSTLEFGKAAIKSGNNAGSGVELFGLDTANPLVEAAGLSDYPVVIWQDRLNSRVKYEYDGDLDLSCNGGSGSINNPCTNADSPTRQLELWATPKTKYGGVIYQPRGAWTLLQASGNYTGALQIITGALKTQGSGNLTLTSPSTPVTRFVAALVE